MHPKFDKDSLVTFGKHFDFINGGTKGNEIEIGNYTRVSLKPLELGSSEGLSTSGDFTVSRNVLVNFKNKEAYEHPGEYLLPYFDGSEISFDPPAPLSTIELVHYTNDKKHAGYIRPVIKSLDYKAYIRT
jgi:hypothetical protein